MFKQFKHSGTFVKNNKSEKIQESQLKYPEIFRDALDATQLKSKINKDIFRRVYQMSQIAQTAQNAQTSIFAISSLYT